ncbi:MAG: transposase [Planctomycetota bacterium]|nr:MAG: transposase [Planctomycetota bacterium]
MVDKKCHKGWYRPRRLPHFDGAGVLQSITFRLADALPRRVVEEFRRELELTEDEVQQRRLRRLIEDYLDAGYGSCLLSNDHCAEIVLEELLRSQQKYYDLCAWVIMPNHVHVLIQLYSEASLPTIVGSWKRWSAKRINELASRQGRLWQTQFWDRYIRDEAHYQRTVNYIHDNPVKAGLAATPEEWFWSSANPRWNRSAEARRAGR